MIRHIVLWQLLPEARGRDRAANAQEVKARLEALPALIPDIVRLEVGVNLPSIPGNHDLCLVADFADEAALARYQDHPAHREVAALVAEVRASRAAVDYQI